MDGLGSSGYEADILGLVAERVQERFGFMMGAPNVRWDPLEERGLVGKGDRLMTSGAYCQAQENRLSLSQCSGLMD